MHRTSPKECRKGDVIYVRLKNIKEKNKAVYRKKFSEKVNKAPIRTASGERINKADIKNI